MEIKCAVGVSAYGVKPKWSQPFSSVTQNLCVVWVGFAGIGGATIGSRPTCNQAAVRGEDCPLYEEDKMSDPCEVGDAHCFSPSTRSTADPPLSPPKPHTEHPFIFAFYVFDS